ncbi:oxygen-independent coproporphyrinogen III oxidase [Chitinimonas naiadis]
MPPPATAVTFDAALIQRYDRPGPRYTSYPTADRFQSSFDASAYRTELAAATRPLSLYVHIPFCDTVCYYCACNKITTKDRQQADRYLDYLEKEIRLRRAQLPEQTTIRQLHLGGGTPTFLRDDQLDRMVGMLKQHFPFDEKMECAIEIDPRRLGEQTLAKLAAHGFNRMSLGVQDLDLDVQVAINRVQPQAWVMGAMQEARRLHFRSVNFDLIYGLPRQTPQSMARTLETVLAWRPDRIALYSYAHLPERFMPQRRIAIAELPTPEGKLALLEQAVASLLDAGYVYIGMDHFALPHDDLAMALAEGRLQRNFQGYASDADCNLIGLGVSAIGKAGDNYVQNHRELVDYYAAMDLGYLPEARGYVLEQDDAIRREVIQSLLCQSELVFAEFEQRWGVDFRHYFALELTELQALQMDGLLEVKPDRLSITPRGRFLARASAMVFDRYLREGRAAGKYSKVI